MVLLAGRGLTLQVVQAQELQLPEQAQVLQLLAGSQVSARLVVKVAGEVLLQILDLDSRLLWLGVKTRYQGGGNSKVGG